MKQLKSALTILVTLLVLSGCKTTRILPDKPVTGNLPDKPERLASQISLPMEIDISSVEALINQKLPSGQIAGDSRKESNTTSYSYQVFRNKPVKFTAQGNELIFKVPIDIRTRGSYTACIGYWSGGRCRSSPISPGVTSTEHGDANPSVDVELRGNLKYKKIILSKPKLI